MRRKCLAYENEDETPLINLTPLIDVVFVLLIGCLIASPFLNIQNISLAKGHGIPMKTVKDNNIVISVHSDNTIYLNQHPTTFAELDAYLTQYKKHSPQSIPLLVQDGESSFRFYQKIKSIIETAGFHEFDIALSPK